MSANQTNTSVQIHIERQDSFIGVENVCLILLNARFVCLPETIVSATRHSTPEPTVVDAFGTPSHEPFTHDGGCKVVFQPYKRTNERNEENKNKGLGQCLPFRLFSE